MRFGNINCSNGCVSFLGCKTKIVFMLCTHVRMFVLNFPVLNPFWLSQYCCRCCYCHMMKFPFDFRFCVLSYSPLRMTDMCLLNSSVVFFFISITFELYISTNQFVIPFHFHLLSFDCIEQNVYFDVYTTVIEQIFLSAHIQDISIALKRMPTQWCA